MEALLLSSATVAITKCEWFNWHLMTLHACSKIVQLRVLGGTGILMALRTQQPLRGLLGFVSYMTVAFSSQTHKTMQSGALQGDQADKAYL